MTHIEGNTTETILLFGYNWTPQEIILTVFLIFSILINIILISEILKPVEKRKIKSKEIKPTDEKDKLYHSLRVLIIIVCVLLIITILWKLLPVLLIMGASKGK